MTKKKKKVDKDKTYKVLKTLLLIGLSVFVIECIVFLIVVLKKHNKNINIDLSQNIVEVSSGYMTVGSSNFSKSDFHKKLSKEAGKVAIYNEKDKLVNEIKFDKYYKSVFYDIKEMSDGYVVVGTVTKKKNGKTFGLIIRYDKDFNVKWEKLYSELDNTVFRSLVIDNNSIYAVGSSIYEPDVVGNEDKGGAIIAKYNMNGELIKTNHFGGNKNGAFYAIIKVNDKFYAVGSDTTDNALIVAFNSELEKIMIKNYSSSNRVGFTSIVAANNSLYVTCAKTVDKESKLLEKAMIVRYSYDGNVLTEKEYSGEEYSIWNKIIDYDGNLYVVGDAAIKKGKKDSILVDYLYKGIVAKYSYDLNKSWSKEYDYNKDDYYKSVIVYKDKLYVVGYTNSKIKKLGSNDKNYMSFINNYSFDGQK